MFDIALIAFTMQFQNTTCVWLTVGKMSSWMFYDAKI